MKKAITAGISAVLLAGCLSGCGKSEIQPGDVAGFDEGEIGYQMIIFLGGLQAINPALYEAAEMDHASAWQQFKDITLPELKPLCVFVFITVTIGAFRMIVSLWTSPFQTLMQSSE